MSIEANQRGVCPHCKLPNRFEGVFELVNSGLREFEDTKLIYGLSNKTMNLSSCRCTQCGEIVLFLNENMIYPLGAKRPSAPQEVPEDIAKDFNEACLVEHLSKKASAALARRCLQNMLHERGIKKRNLSKEIDEAIKTLPPHLKEAIDAIRVIGNFAAHPTKLTNTGIIVEVEDGETEWILNVLEQLFNFYYVEPAETKAKRDALNAKLAAAEKEEMK